MFPNATEGYNQLDYLQFISRLYLLIWDICLEFEHFDMQCIIFPQFCGDKCEQRLFFKTIIESKELHSNHSVDFFSSNSNIPSVFQQLNIKPLDMSTTSMKFSDQMCYLDERMGDVTGSTKLLPKYEYVACGGTFDNFHYGHKILLTMALTICTKALVIGITSPTLLVNKKNVDYIESLEIRRMHVTSFLNTVIQANEIVSECSLDNETCTFKRKTGDEWISYDVLMPTLFDGYGPTITDPRIQAIIVSSETISGALKANAIRESKGYAPLFIYVVKRNNTATLSSTFLRKFASTHTNSTGVDKVNS